MIFVKESLDIQKSEHFLNLEVDNKIIDFYKTQKNVFVVVSDANNNIIFSNKYDTIEHFNKEQWDEGTLRNAMKNYIANYKPEPTYENAIIKDEDLEKYLILLNIEGGEKSFRYNLKKTPIFQLCDFEFNILTPSYSKAMWEGIPAFDEKYIFGVQKNKDNTIAPSITWHDNHSILKTFDIDRLVKDFESIVKNEENIDETYTITKGYNIEGKKIRNNIYIGKDGFKESVKLLKENPTIEGLQIFRDSLLNNRIVMKREWLEDKYSFIVNKDGYQIKEDDINKNISFDKLPGNAIVYVSKEDVFYENGNYYANKIYTKNDLKSFVFDKMKDYQNEEKGDKNYDL